MEKRILVTGFGPFGEEMRNPSLEAVMALPERAGDALILKEELPVLFGTGGDRLLALIEQLRPDAVLCTGLAAGRKALTPEVIAVNLKNARIPDIFMACGTEDFLIENNRQLNTFLTKEEVHHVYLEGPGVHDMVFWSEYIVKAIEWMFR